MTRGVVMNDTATGKTWPIKVHKLPFAILVDMLAADETWGVVMDESAIDSGVTIEVYFWAVAGVKLPFSIKMGVALIENYQKARHRLSSTFQLLQDAKTNPSD